MASTSDSCLDKSLGRRVGSGHGHNRRGSGTGRGERRGERRGGKGEGEGDGDGEGDEEGAVYSGDQAAEEEDTDGMGVAARGLVRHVNERLRGRRVRRAGQGGEERVWDEPRRV